MEIMFPVGRMIGGSVYKAVPETDNFNKPKLNTDGTPIESFAFGIAIPKHGEQHWNQTPWGQQVWAIGASAHPQAHTNPAYAWKIKDGDSTVPNRNNRVPREQEGYAGNWIVWFKQRWAPKLVTDNGNTPLIEPEGVVPGYYIEVYANVTGNTGPTPGLYMNPIAVNRVAYGEKIINAAVDTTAVGFGKSPLPAGASLTPVGGSFVPPAATPAAVPPPNPAILNIPPATPPVPATPAKVMLPAANGATYEQMIGAGWTDELMVQHGMMKIG